MYIVSFLVHRRLCDVFSFLMQSSFAKTCVHSFFHFIIFIFFLYFNMRRVDANELTVFVVFGAYSLAGMFVVLRQLVSDGIVL